MKVSKKEKYLLGVLGAVLTSVLYYQFVYTPQVEKVKELKGLKVEKQEEYDTIMDTIRTLEQRRGEIKVLNQQIIDRSSPFYPKIIQENLILEIDKLLAESQLKATFSFSGITVSNVEIAIPGSNIELQTSFDDIVRDYNSNFGKEGSNENNTSSSSSSMLTENNEVEVNGQATTEQIKVSLNFSGSYTQLKDFVRLVNNNERKIVITNISLSGKGTDEEVTGSMNLEFYAIPKLGDIDNEYYMWLLNNTYGKNYPFSLAEASGTTIEQLGNSDNPYDFVMLVKPVSSDLPTVMLGQANDGDNLSYVYGDSKGIEEVEIVLTEENGKYYYKYRTTTSNHPISYNGNGIEFKPLGDEIVLNIMSSKRLGEDDLSGVSINFINNTNKEVNIVIENEDDNDPRVAVASEGNNVKVTKK